MFDRCHPVLKSPIFVSESGGWETMENEQQERMWTMMHHYRAWTRKLGFTCSSHLTPVHQSSLVWTVGTVQPIHYPQKPFSLHLAIWQEQVQLKMHNRSQIQSNLAWGQRGHQKKLGFMLFVGNMTYWNLLTKYGDFSTFLSKYGDFVGFFQNNPL